jgi:hypothetical protein
LKTRQLDQYAFQKIKNRSNIRIVPFYISLHDKISCMIFLLVLVCGFVWAKRGDQLFEADGGEWITISFMVLRGGEYKPLIWQENQNFNTLDAGYHQYKWSYYPVKIK